MGEFAVFIEHSEAKNVLASGGLYLPTYPDLLCRECLAGCPKGAKNLI